MSVSPCIKVAIGPTYLGYHVLILDQDGRWDGRLLSTCAIHEGDSLMMSQSTFDKWKSQMDSKKEG